MGSFLRQGIHSLTDLFRTWFPPPTGSPRVAANTLVRMSLLWSLDGVVGTQCLMNVSVTSQLYSGPGDSHEGRQRPLERGGSPAHRQEDEQLLASTPADLCRYHPFGETSPSLKLQPFLMLPIKIKQGKALFFSLAFIPNIPFILLIYFLPF